MFSSLLLHVPHASTVIPEEYRKSFICDLETELNQMTDFYTDEIFSCEAEQLCFPVSRLVCDVERFRNDEDETMAERGMGAVYLRNHLLRPLRKVTPPERDQILKRWYDPHHLLFTEKVNERLEAFDRCMIIDCHSFSEIPLPYEPSQKKDRPDFCIGTDPFHTPENLSTRILDRLRKLGYSAALNTPFSGAIVPLEHYRRDRRVSSVMIEVNRGLYLDNEYRRNNNFRQVAKHLSALIDDLL